jgi:hypothetical protein
MSLKEREHLKNLTCSPSEANAGLSKQMCEEMKKKRKVRKSDSLHIFDLFVGLIFNLLLPDGSIQNGISQN